MSWDTVPIIIFVLAFVLVLRRNGMTGGSGLNEKRRDDDMFDDRDTFRASHNRSRTPSRSSSSSSSGSTSGSSGKHSSGGASKKKR